MRKSLRFLMALVLALGLCVPAHAADTPVVSVSSGDVSPGGEVTLTVSIEHNPGIAGMVLYVYYDTSVFTADPDSDVSKAGNFSSGGMMGNTIALADRNGRYDGPADKDGILVLWYNPSGTNTTGDGRMLEVTLHANAAAPAGSYEVGVGYSWQNVRNQDREPVALTTLPGSVTVTGGNPPAGRPGSQDNPQQAPQNPTRPAEKPDSPYENPAEGPTVNPAAETAVLFRDAAGNWAEDYIRQAAARGLIQGYNGLYRPNDSMTRAELVTILWRANGSPAGEAASFTDLTQDWYLDAVAWAERTGVVNGVGSGRFDPDGHVTREQLAAILHRMAGSPAGMELMLSGLYDQQYTDAASVSGWAKASLYWTVFHEIYCGEAALSVGQALAPQADASRAQIAVMMVRYLDKN